MDAHIYILCSKSLNKFYTGSTELEPTKRLELHLNKVYGNEKFTSIANDWELYYQHLCSNIRQAKLIENHIKKMKSRVYIQNLKKYPEIMTKLLLRYPGSSR
ncbi:GIY-YIG nuclease family protein [Roseivirga spongicola]|uniref:GIY-YIG domain-containing protein n=1 Tax=Roseivirga spongicola TaxID=333140 RepID=A0A150WZP2_9BACT|nr:GIY-YIG nuclease family protein [Roseivirga spongicola]KYG71896.1 hypothetical protein AWW68_17940 [Roseivirga spongicola]MBO6662123.1 GIY-YIG nuclease family protein [Roseivirga sp.]MBO6910149.1 GIY-YIG nuclease family protein [Roseivirga sp.]